MRYSKQKIIEQLRELGLREGDNIFVSADLMKVGYFNKKSVTNSYGLAINFSDNTWPEWNDIYSHIYRCLSTISEKATLCFSKDSISNSGSLANAYIKYAQNSIRSPHPVYSCIGGGPC